MSQRTANAAAASHPAISRRTETSMVLGVGAIDVKRMFNAYAIVFPHAVAWHVETAACYSFSSALHQEKRIAISRPRSPLFSVGL